MRSMVALPFVESGVPPDSAITRTEMQDTGTHVSVAAALAAAVVSSDLILPKEHLASVAVACSSDSAQITWKGVWCQCSYAC